MADILSESGEIVKDTAAGIVKNAANPYWIIGFLLVGGAVFVGSLILCAVVYGAKPLLDAQLESVSASTEAIRSNAETNRQTAKAVLEIKDTMDRQLRATEKVLSNQSNIFEGVEQALKDHQKIMGSIQQRGIPDKPNG